MKKTSSYHHLISASATLVQHHLKALHLKVKREKNKEKRNSFNTLLSRMLTKELAFENDPDFISTLSAGLQPNEGVRAIERYNMELQIKEKRKAFDKAALKHSSLEGKSKKLQKKKIDLEGKIQNNSHRLQVCNLEVQAKRHQLADSFNQRKITKGNNQCIIKL